MSGSFWIYWAVTLPLTITVVGIWLVWTNRQDVLHFIVNARKRFKPQDAESALSFVPGTHAKLS